MATTFVSEVELQKELARKARTAISVYQTKAICNRAVTEISVLPRTTAIRTGLGAGCLNKRFASNGGQVALNAGLLAVTHESVHCLTVLRKISCERISAR